MPASPPKKPAHPSVMTPAARFLQLQKRLRSWKTPTPFDTFLRASGRNAGSGELGHRPPPQWRVLRTPLQEQCRQARRSTRRIAIWADETIAPNRKSEAPAKPDSRAQPGSSVTLDGIPY